MKNPESKNIDGNIYFNNFMVQKETDNFFGVYMSLDNTKYGELITSGTSIESASKKARLLQMGYDIRKQGE